MELEPRTAAPAHATGAVEFVPLSAIDGDATFRLRAEGDVTALAASIGRLGHLVPVELRPMPGAPADPPRYQVVAGFRRLAALRLLARERVLARVHATLDDEDAWAIALAHALLGEPLSGSDLEALRARLRDERIAPWADELVDEALVRAPVEPDLRERFFDFLSAAPLPSEEGRAYGGEGGPDEEDEPGAAGEAALGRGPAPGRSTAPAPAGGERASSREGSAPGGAALTGAASGGGAAVAAAEARPEGDGGAPGPLSEEIETVEVTPEELAADLARRLSELNQDLAVAFEAWAELPEEGRRMIVEQARYVAELFPHLEGR